MIYFYVGDFDSISMEKSLKDRISHAIFQGPLLTQIIELKGVTQITDGKPPEHSMNIRVIP